MSVFVEESQSVGAGRLCTQSEPNLLCRFKEGAGLQEPHRPFVPLGVGEALDAALRLYRQAPLPIVGLSALFVVPYTVAGLYINPTATGNMLSAPFLKAAGKPVPLATPQVITGPGIAAAVAAAILAPLVYCALVRIADQARRGEPPAMGKALVWSLRRLFALLVTGLMSLIAVAVLSLAALFLSTTVMGIGILAVNGSNSAAPGIFAMIWTVVVFAGSALVLHGVWLSFLFVPQVILLENRGYFRAIGRSLSLAVPRLFRTIGIVWSAVLLTLSLSYVASLPQLLWDQAVGATGTNIVLHLAEGVVRIFTFPLLALITTVAYHDYRLRAEGLDLADRLSKLEGEAGHA